VILKRACENQPFISEWQPPFINRSRNVPQAGQKSFSVEHDFASAESLAADPTRRPARPTASATEQIHCE
jgi:hypothetical protein